MAEERVSNELLYEVLRSIQDRMGRIETRLHRIEDRMAHVETLLGDIVKSDLSRNAEMTDLERRVARIERRLELNEGNA